MCPVQKLFARSFLTLPKYNNSRSFNNLQITNQINQIEKNSALISIQQNSFAEDSREGKEIYVGNLAWKTDEESLEDFFSKFGDIEKCNIVRDPEGRSKGFAFVKFYETSDVEKIISEGDNIMIDGRQCRVNLSKSARGDKKPMRSEREPSPETETLFVGNLNFDSTEDSIKDFFSDCGEIKECRLSFKDNGQHKGFCHIEFDSVDVGELLFLISTMEKNKFLTRKEVMLSLISFLSSPHVG